MARQRMDRASWFARDLTCLLWNASVQCAFITKSHQVDELVAISFVPNATIDTREDARRMAEWRRVRHPH